MLVDELVRFDELDGHADDGDSP